MADVLHENQISMPAALFPSLFAFFLKLPTQRYSIIIGKLNIYPRECQHAFVCNYLASDS